MHLASLIAMYQEGLQPVTVCTSATLFGIISVNEVVVVCGVLREI